MSTVVPSLPITLMGCHLPTCMYSPGTLMVEYAVAYKIADSVTKAPTAAGIALAQALAAADTSKTASMVLPILLASSQLPVIVDFSQGKWHPLVRSLHGINTLCIKRELFFCVSRLAILTMRQQSKHKLAICCKTPLCLTPLLACSGLCGYSRDQSVKHMGRHNARCCQ